MLQFFGTYNHKIDDKGRVALPTKFRKTYERAIEKEEIDSADLVIAPSVEKTENGFKYLCVYTHEDLDERIKSWFESLGGYNPRNRDHVNLSRRLHADCEPVVIDAAKRINIPAKYRELAGLDKEVALVGTDGCFEI